MGNIEIAIGFVICAALMIWGAGLKKSVIQIAFIAVMLILYGITQYLWPDIGKSIFAIALFLFGVSCFFFKDKITVLLSNLKKSNDK